MSTAPTRTEHDALGAVEVPTDVLWGAQTQRALHHFDISTETLPPELIRALAFVKQACARTNATLGELPAPIARAIEAAVHEVLAGDHDAQFPLRVWQSGSGTQTNMNMNEVLAHRATAVLRSQGDPHAEVHPNDHVNRSQSSNDVFPTALHVACAMGVQHHLLPALGALRGTLHAKAAAYGGLVKIGRTHLQDAVPLTLGQELSGYEAQLAQAEAGIVHALSAVCALAIGGTAVGTGLNAPPGFGEGVARDLAHSLSLPFTTAPNRFAVIAAHDAIVALHGSLKVLAVALMKLANDLRWLASGPRCGLGELRLPANEPGSSIMPGKVNPSQCEAMLMLCVQVLGNDTVVGFAGASGNFELNTFKPVMAHNVLQSLRLLADGCTRFEAHCLRGLTADEPRIAALRDRTLMLVTALTPHIGYDRAAAIALDAHAQDITLREAAQAHGVDMALFDHWVRADRMV
ncbi:class II fumarate hydratase [uncultured Aquabacterium sp.]|jgi:fumarate hydratase class II|uniref:class II fumarate hydratase n=1 Tax=uncultured Aquabacterium sp. TaxID=158753 RepID=UPI002621ACEE|nr:class II fumarate hydratase [uncultured Aquabacterium sp.]